MSLFYRLVLTILCCLQTGIAQADIPKIEAVSVRPSGDKWIVSVTLSHPDSGWDHYADGWEILTEDGTSLGLRTLHHPHVNEQPFTRSLGPITLPEDAKSIWVRARCNHHGWGEIRVRADVSPKP